MKALPSIAFSGFRGTASEVTARQTGGRTVLSGRAWDILASAHREAAQEPDAGA